MPLARDVREAIAGCQLECLDRVLYSPGSKEAAIMLAPGCSEGHGLEMAAAITPLVFYPWVFKAGESPPLTTEAWVPIARGTVVPDHEKLAVTWLALDDELSAMCSLAFTKAASGDYSPTVRTLGELSGYLPGGHYSWQLGNVPRYLQGTLGGGLIGAGLGYGAGWLGSRVLPRTWDRSRLPKTFAILGSMAGMAPGLAAMASGAAKGDISGADALFDAPPPNVHQYEPTRPTYPNGPTQPAAFEPNLAYNPQAQLPAPPSTYKVVNAPITDGMGDPVHPIVKKAFSQTGYELDYNPPMIPIDYIAQSVWKDPRVANQLSVPMRAATLADYRLTHSWRSVLYGIRPRLAGSRPKSKLGRAPGLICRRRRSRGSSARRKHPVSFASSRQPDLVAGTGPNQLCHQAPLLVSVRPRHGVLSTISGACSLFACDGVDYFEWPLCGVILRAGS